MAAATKEPGYWGRAGASLFDCLELLHAATAGQCSGFTQPLVHEIAGSISAGRILTTSGTRTLVMLQRACSPMAIWYTALANE